MATEHWLNAKIKSIFFTACGGTPSTARKDYWEKGNISWINSGMLILQRDMTISPAVYMTEFY